MNSYYYRVEGVRALQRIVAPDQRTADANAKFLGNATLAYGCSDGVPDIYSDVQRPVPPHAGKIADPWGLSRLA